MSNAGLKVVIGGMDLSVVVNGDLPANTLAVRDGSTAWAVVAGLAELMLTPAPTTSTPAAASLRAPSALPVTLPVRKGGFAINKTGIEPGVVLEAVNRLRSRLTASDVEILTASFGLNGQQTEGIDCIAARMGMRSGTVARLRLAALETLGLNRKRRKPVLSVA